MFPNVNVTQEWIQTDDFNALFSKSWAPKSPPMATLVIVHGFAEHVNRYNRFATYLANEGVICHSFDQRGWGETVKRSGQYSDNQGYDTILKDLDNFVLSHKDEGIPLFIFGHSMGGGIVFNYLSRSDVYKGVKLVSGAIASSPHVELSLPISTIKYYSLLMASNIVPNITVNANIQYHYLSHDEEEVRIIKEDPLIRNYVTLATSRSIIDSGANVRNFLAAKINTPILVSHSDMDPVNSYESVVDVYKKFPSEDKELRTWPGLLHELLNEKLPERQQISEYYLNWIKKRIVSVRH